MFELVLLTVCLKIPLSGEPVSAVVYPVIEFEADLPGRAGGLALPFVQFVDPIAPPGTRQHELQHHRQMRNLGFLSYAVGYLGTLGRAFEDYLGDSYMMDFPTYNACGGYL